MTILGKPLEDEDGSVPPEWVKTKEDYKEWLAEYIK